MTRVRLCTCSRTRCRSTSFCLVRRRSGAFRYITLETNSAGAVTCVPITRHSCKGFRLRRPRPETRWVCSAGWAAGVGAGGAHLLPEVHPRHTRGGPVRAASLLFPVSAHRSPPGPARPAPRGGLGPRAAGAGAPRGTRSRRGRRQDVLPDVVGEGRILIAYRLLLVRNVCIR